MDSSMPCKCFEPLYNSASLSCPTAINRLDAVTSGVVIFANVADPIIRERFQPPEEAQGVASSEPSQAKIVRKEYVCRVLGEFPADPVVVKEPILQTAGKVTVDPTGKASETRFERIWFDPTSNSSLVRCKNATFFVSFFSFLERSCFRSLSRSFRTLVLLTSAFFIPSRSSGYRKAASDSTPRCVLEASDCQRQTIQPRLSTRTVKSGRLDKQWRYQILSYAHPTREATLHAVLHQPRDTLSQM